LGVEQEEKPPPSSSHANVEEPSVEENVKVAAAELESRFGLESMVVFGAAVSIVKERLEGDSPLFALSVALTRIV
jgi:hypothetical protein